MQKTGSPRHPGPMIAVYFGILGSSFIYYHVKPMTCVSRKMNHVERKHWPWGEPVCVGLYMSFCDSVDKIVL